MHAGFIAHRDQTRLFMGYSFIWDISGVKQHQPTYSTAVNSVNLLIHLISIIEKYHFCTGNGDEKYHPLQAEQNGIFKGCTGQYIHACLYSFFEY